MNQPQVHIYLLPFEPPSHLPPQEMDFLFLNLLLIGG